MTKIICPEPGSQLTIGSTTDIAAGPAEMSDPEIRDRLEIIADLVAERKKTYDLELALARRDALLQRALYPLYGIVGAEQIIKDIERELEGK